MSSDRPFEILPGREVTGAGGRRYTIWIERAEVAGLVTRASDARGIGPRLRALFQRTEHRMRQRAGWRLLVREGGADDASPGRPFVDEVYETKDEAIARGESLAARLGRPTP